MTIREIHIIPHKNLKKVCEKVRSIDKKILENIKDMLDTMYNASGIGLAAPQVGILKRLVVIDIANKKDNPSPLVLINPEIVWKSKDQSFSQEGCLSIPEKFYKVARYKKIKITYTNEVNQKKELHAEGLLSICIQHEIDHINGILYIDHLSSMKRNMIIKKFKKIHKLI